MAITVTLTVKQAEQTIEALDSYLDSWAGSLKADNGPRRKARVKLLTFLVAADIARRGQS